MIIHLHVVLLNAFSIISLDVPAQLMPTALQKNVQFRRERISESQKVKGFTSSQDINTSHMKQKVHSFVDECECCCGETGSRTQNLLHSTCTVRYDAKKMSYR
jgi:hypothetical protein